MHAAIDVIYRRNHIHHCTRGLWLDWQAQGTRVTQNLFHHNTFPISEEQITLDAPGLGEDIWIEVSHGPTLVDNNILLSERSVRLAAQGIAMVHNLIAGSLVAVGIGTDNGAKTLASPRYTPYHVPHRTEIAGFMTFLHGDVRFYNNIFVQQPMRDSMKRIMEYQQGEGKNGWDDGNLITGTWMYNHGYQTHDEWLKEFEGYCGMGSAPSDRYYIPLPVWSEGNVYLNGAEPWSKEQNPCIISNEKASVQIQETDCGWILRSNLQTILSETVETVSTRTLGIAFEPEQMFENPDGTPIIFDADFLGVKRTEASFPGPFAELKETIRVF